MEVFALPALSGKCLSLTGARDGYYSVHNRSQGNIRL